MKFIVKDCDPLTGEVQDDGYQEEYRVCNYLLSIVCHSELQITIIIVFKI